MASLKKNAVLNTIPALTSVLVPLVTYPYVARMLGSEGIGAVNYAGSIAGYCAMLGSFGTASYAVRTGARKRDDQKAFQKFFSQVLTINGVFTLAACLILIALCFVPALTDYRWLLLIQGLQIPFAWLGPSWMNRAYEDFGYIAKRAVAIQLLVLALTFLLIHNSGDTAMYAVVLVSSYVGTGLANFFWCRKRVRYRLTSDVGLKGHLIPMAQVFAATVTMTIYVSADQTMLGAMKGDAAVGVYGCAVKVYSVAKNFYWAALSVAIPRMSGQLGKVSDEEWHKKAQGIFDTAVLVFLPLSVGIFFLAKPAVLFLGGEEFEGAAMPLRILSAALIFACLSMYLNNVIAVPMGKFGAVTKASVISAVENVALNLWFIPKFGVSGAAVTTLIAEATACLVVLIAVRIKPDMKSVVINLLQCLAGCAGIGAVCILVTKRLGNGLLPAVLAVAGSVIVYAAVLRATRNKAFKALAGRKKKAA